MTSPRYSMTKVWAGRGQVATTPYPFVPISCTRRWGQLWRPLKRWLRQAAPEEGQGVGHSTKVERLTQPSSEQGPVECVGCVGLQKQRPN